jgi:hypothetical protein
MRATFLIALLGLCGFTWAQTTRRAAATTRPAAATTRPAGTTTRPTATTQAATRPADPLETPQSAVIHLFKLMQSNDAGEVRAILMDPPPLEELKPQVNAVAWKLNKGAKFELMETEVRKRAAVVIYRTTYPKGRTEMSPVLLLQRYDRWKVILGPINPARYTPAEKQDLLDVGSWMQERLAALNAGSAATQPKPPAPPPP